MASGLSLFRRSGVRVMWSYRFGGPWSTIVGINVFEEPVRLPRGVNSRSSYRS